MDSEPITPDGARKPDPSEPWRYVCECGGQVSGARKTWRYRCKRCGSWWDRDELVDQKAD